MACSRCGTWAATQTNTCYATSRDGLTWDKPALDVQPGTNIVIDKQLRDSTTVWLDHEEKNRALRFKMAAFKEHTLLLLSSPDGIHWTRQGESDVTGDRSTIFYNPFRRKWVYSLRDEQLGGAGRFRRYWEHDDFVAGAKWTQDQLSVLDRRRLGRVRREPTTARGLSCTTSTPSRTRASSSACSPCGAAETAMREKPNDVCVGFSRDGFHWWRPDRRAFIPVSEQVGDWNWANVQTAGGCCLVVGDKLYFYVSGRSGVPGTGLPGTCATGLAMLRRDGFASMGVEDAKAGPRIAPPGDGVLITRPVRFSGRHLFVNADLGTGALRVAVEDLRAARFPVSNSSRACRCEGTGRRCPCTWPARLERVAGQPVRFRFSLTSGRLYAFWVSGSPSGESGGYVAAGGPGFRGGRDLSGLRA